MSRLFPSFILAITLATPACAQERSGPAYEAAMKGAVMVMSFDALAAKCEAKGGFAPNDAARIRQWSAAQHADAMRTRAQALHRDATSGGHLDQAVGAIVSMIVQAHADPCSAAARLAESDDAQFATLVPDLPAARGAAGAVKGRSASIRPGPASPLIGQIDSFGFDSQAAMGSGGFIMTDIFPVVLFRDGSALTDVSDLSDIAASRRAHPDHWTRWRRNAGRIEFMKSGGWERIAFNRTYASLPPGFRLDGYFSRMSGVGNIGVGGSDSAMHVRNYRFWPDGGVLRGSGSRLVF